MQTTLIAVLGLVSLFISWILMLVLPDMRSAAWGLLGLGVVLLAAASIVSFRGVRSALVSKRGKFGTSTTIMVSIFVGIVLLVNAISINSYHTFDFTGASQFTLTSQTKDVLTNKLEVPVKVICFFSPIAPEDDPTGGVLNSLRFYALILLTEYQNYTDKISITVIDPDEHPDQAVQYGVSEYQTVVFETELGRRLVSPLEIVQEAEFAFTSAILEVSGINQQKVYFLTGHSEGDISSTNDSGYYDAYSGLRANLFQVRTLNLLINRSIPEDCAALIIAGPRTPLESEEVEIIERYIKSGKLAVILLNPNPPEGIKQLLSSFDIEVEDGLIVDPASYAAPSVDIPSVPRARNSLGLSTMYFPGATALIPEDGYEPDAILGTVTQIIWGNKDTNIEMRSLIRSSQDSWLEKDFNPYENPEFHEGEDLKGPLNIGFFITTLPTDATEESEEDKQIRLIVIGDSDFASNKHFSQGSNSSLFLISVKELATSEELISIDPKVLQTRRYILNAAQERWLNISSIGLLPILILAIGGIIWWRRR